MLKLIELFSGIGAQAKALENLGIEFESHRTCEWEVNAIKSYKEIHFPDTGLVDTLEQNNKEFLVNALFEMGISSDGKKPMTREQIARKGEPWLKEVYKDIVITNNLVDITKVHAEDLDIDYNDTYLVTYSFPCGLAGTKVITRNGYKNIEDVKVGDKVLTHNNRYCKVNKIMSRVSDHYYKLKGLGVPKLYLTEEHPLYVLRDGKEQWVKVKDLKTTDYFGFNVNQESKDVNLSNEHLWLLGRYVADGFVNKHLYNSVLFAIGMDKEQEFLNNIPSDFKDKFKRFEKSCMEYRIADKDFQELCLQFGNGALNKCVPNWVFDLPNEKLQSFFDGYISGDGHIRKRSDSEEIMFTTVSENLFLSMQRIVAKLYGIVCSCYIRHDKRKETFNDTYNCQFHVTDYHRDQIVLNDKIYTRIKHIERINQDTPVFNFEVDKDNSYTCQNVNVHNCQDLSIAGTQKGMEKGSGTRSGLLWEVERILQECDIKPKFLLMENVIQVHGKKHMDDFESWLKSLEDMGYSNYYQDLNAKDYGVPQNRNRCFMLSVLDDTTPFAFPEEKQLTKRLKDMLEVDVEENFYLKGDPLKNLVLDRKENKSGIIEDGNLNRSGQKDTVISPEGICTSLMATDYKQPKQITVNLKDLLEDTVDEKFYLDEEQVSKLKIKNKDALIYDKSMLGYEENSREYNDIMPAITSREYKEPRCVNETVLKDIGVKQVGNIVHTGNWDNPQRGRIYSPDGLSPSLNTVGGGGLEPKIIESDMIHVGDIPKEVLNDNERQRRVYSDEGVSPSLLGRNDSPKLLQNLRIRKLTPKECWRLMGFSDDDFKKAEKVNSNSQLYKQAGNSIVVDVLEAIFSKMVETYPDCFEEKFMWDEEL